MALKGYSIVASYSSTDELLNTSGVFTGEHEVIIKNSGPGDTNQANVSALVIGELV